MHMTGLLRRALLILVTACLTVGGLVADPPAAQAQPAAAAPGQLVLKITPSADLAALCAQWGVAVVDTVLASSGIYLMSVPFDPTGIKERDVEKKQAEAVEKMAENLGKADGVVYAEPNYEVTVANSGYFYFWPAGQPGSTADETAYWSQPAADTLALAQAHLVSRGAGAVVAVLDTGIDLDHPAFADRLVPGYDYIDDDAVPDDVGDGVDADGDGLVDEAVGHGTHVTGLVHLVAPDATLMPRRVLDSEGNGNAYLVAEAITDAVRAGADVISLSSGVDRKIESKVLSDAIRFADASGVVLVAAAGNDSSGSERYPAANAKVLGVASTDAASSAASGPRLAPFSNYGSWVAVAAPGVDLVSAVPGGGYRHWSGTSMSAPLVAGEVALLRSAAPQRKADDLVKKLKESTIKLTSGPKVDKGVVDIVQALDKVS